MVQRQEDDTLEADQGTAIQAARLTIHHESGRDFMIYEIGFSEAQMDTLIAHLTNDMPTVQDVIMKAVERIEPRH